MTDVTRILCAVEAGDPRASEQLLPLVYDELRRIAGRKIAHESPGQTLDATALVHEAYLRLVDTKLMQDWNSRGHFFSAAAEAMRRILVERARHKRSVKAGGEFRRQDITHLENAATPDNDELLDIDAALEKLEAQDRRKADLVKLRFFAGLTIDQAAEVLGVSPTTANNDWAFARCWLRAEIEGSDSSH